MEDKNRAGNQLVQWVQEVCVNRFAWSNTVDGISISLVREERSLLKSTTTVIPISDWVSGGDASVLIGLSALAELLQDVADQSTTSVLMPHYDVSNLSEQQAKALNLPLSIPFQLRVWSEGRVLDNSIQLQSEFLDMGREIFIDNRMGSILTIGRASYRLPSPLYQLCEIVRHFPEDKDSKLEFMSEASALLGINSTGITSDDLLANIKLRHVSAFSATVTGNLDDPELSPVLFAKHVIDSASENEELCDEAQQILTVGQSLDFSTLFKEDSTARQTYLLESGEYLYIDPSIRAALEGFRKVSHADSATRRAFIKAPQEVLSEFVTGQDNVDDLLQVAFVATSQFSERVTEINEWVAPDLPFLVTEVNQWGTDVLIFGQVGSANSVVIPKDMLGDAVDSVSTALRSGQTQVSFNGTSIPVTKGLLDEMESYLPVSPEPTPVDPTPPDEPPEVKPGPFVVQTLDNFQAINFQKKKEPPEQQLAYATPRMLAPRTKLLKHQQVGVKWLIDSYNQGMPGVLIADDMGLGKTLQALVLLALYREQLSTPDRKPALIIAPSGLLKNWIKEVDIHLGGNGLGTILEAHGRGLRDLRAAGVTGKDIDKGVSILDAARLAQADVILTTYESLRDYQISFAQVSFGLVVFDEIQKVKNPVSLISKSAATVNSKFCIGLSGTPVENSLADLWTILDVVAPGLLNFSLRDFLKLFAGDPEDEVAKQALEKLQTQLLETVDGSTPIILRRMKDTVFKDVGPNGLPMPKKLIVPAEDTSQVMPQAQATSYSHCSNQVQSRQITMLEALHGFRNISRSPSNPDSWIAKLDEAIAESARLSQAFMILDSIHGKKEKVLVFIETRAVQPIVATIMKERYGMKKTPLIVNGAISGESRQKAVDEFQAGGDGFDAMIISPKAGGVGLTLTAANHVVHLERWWNPAVEDQCNDRAYRIGQDKDVTIYTPVAMHPQIGDSSYDLVLDRILTRKRLLARSLFVPTELSTEDFDEMLNPDSSERSFRPISLEESYLIETGEGFEDYVGSDLHDSGFKIQKTPRSHDGGCDLIARLGHTTILCQVKQVRSAKILNRGVEEIIQAKSRFSDFSHTLLITNATSLTSSQRNLATREGVIVICGDCIDSFGPTLLRHLANA
jgi:Holliday junction resolvase-like predicted endonuclease